MRPDWLIVYSVVYMWICSMYTCVLFVSCLEECVAVSFFLSFFCFILFFEWCTCGCVQLWQVVLQLMSHDRSLAAKANLWIVSIYCAICSTERYRSQVPSDGVLVERRTRERKAASSNPGRSGRTIFVSRVNFVCWLLFCARSTAMLPQLHVKDPGHSARIAGGRLHLNTHTPLTQRSRSGQTTPLSRHSVGTYQETSSHASRQGNARSKSSQIAEPLWTGSGLKSGISVHELFSTFFFFFF